MKTVVVIDDSEADRYLVGRALARTHLDVRLVEFSSAVEALRVFSDEAIFSEKIGPTPPAVLVLLDINMPRMNGFEFLEQLKSHASPDQCFVVMMFTSSNRSGEREKADTFDVVADYIVKPITTEKFLEVAQRSEFRSGETGG